MALSNAFNDGVLSLFELRWMIELSEPRTGTASVEVLPCDCNEGAIVWMMLSRGSGEGVAVGLRLEVLLKKLLLLLVMNLIAIAAEGRFTSSSVSWIDLSWMMKVLTTIDLCELLLLLCCPHIMWNSAAADLFPSRWMRTSASRLLKRKISRAFHFRGRRRRR